MPSTNYLLLHTIHPIPLYSAQVHEMPPSNLDETLWRRLCTAKYKRINKPAPFAPTWYSLYFTKSLQENARWSAKPVLTGSVEVDNRGITSLSFNEDYLVIGTGAFDEAFELATLFIDKTVHVYDMHSRRLLWQLYGHTDSIYDVKIRRDKIISAGADRKIRVWQFKDDPTRPYAPPAFLHHKTLRGHTKTVYNISMDDHLIASASRDCTVKVWSQTTHKCLWTLLGHDKDVLSVQINHDRLASAGLDKTVRLWDVETGKCTRTIYDSSWISALQFDHRYLVFGGEKKIKIYDIKSGKLVRALKGHDGMLPPGWVTCLQFDEDKVITGALNKGVKVWDLNYGVCLNSWKAHSDKVTGLQFDQNRLLTCSRDRTVKSWDFSAPASEQAVEDLQKNILKGDERSGCGIQ